MDSAHRQDLGSGTTHTVRYNPPTRANNPPTSRAVPRTHKAAQRNAAHVGSRNSPARPLWGRLELISRLFQPCTSLQSAEHSSATNPARSPSCIKYIGTQVKQALLQKYLFAQDPLSHMPHPPLRPRSEHTRDSNSRHTPNI